MTMSKHLHSQLQAHKYWIGLTRPEKLNILHEIYKYWDLNEVKYIHRWNELDFRKFLDDNEGDQTIVKAITSY
jgi:hypothetical protein